MARTKLNIDKYDKIAGGGVGKTADYIDHRKTKSFVALFELIKTKLGNYEKARASVRMSNDDMSKMKNKGKLTAKNAKRIYSAYRKLCA